MTAPRPLPYSQYVTPEGKLTNEGMKLLQEIARLLNDHEERIRTLEP